MLQRKWGMHHPQRGYGMPRSGKRIGAWPKVEGAGLGGLRVNRAQSSDGNTMTVAQLDFGDAPTAAQSGFANSYPVTVAQDGARHGGGQGEEGAAGAEGRGVEAMH